MEEKNVRDINEEIIFKLTELNSILEKIISVYEKKFSTSHKSWN